MTDRLNLPLRYRRILETLLREHVPDAEVWAYGSRVTGESHDGSNLDLVVRGPELKPLGDGFFDLLEAIEKSNIPILVQAHDWARLPESFHREIEKDYVVLQEKKEQSRPALDLATADEAAPLRELLAYTRDGEWGAGEKNANLTPMRVIRGTDFEAVRRGSLTNVPTRYIRPEASARKTLKPWDILIETAGGSKNRPTGRTLLIHPRILERSEIPVTCASFARFLRIHCDRANPAYIYWFLQYLYTTGEMEKHQVQHTGIARFQFTNFAANIEVPLPPLSEQRAIAHILGTLDDKIELNRRMNETLEEMARTLFKSWFVDFLPVRAKQRARKQTGDPVRSKAALMTPSAGGSDWTVERARAYLESMDKNVVDLFPDRLVESELGEIPEEWEVKALGDVVDVLGGTTPSTKVSEYWRGGTHCWATPKDLSELSSPVLLDTERKITESGLARIGSGLLPKGSLLLSSRAPIGYLAINEVPVAINQGFIGIPPCETVSNLFLLNWCSRFHEVIVNHANGSTFLEISKKDFRHIPLVIPDEAVMTAFEGFLRPLYDHIVSNERESSAVVAQRDVLLPKLVLGEVAGR